MRHAGRHEAEVRPSRRQRHAERLALADADVRATGAPLAGRLQQRQRGRIDDTNHHHAECMGLIGERIDILQTTEEVRLLDDHCGDVLARVRRECSGVDAARVRHAGDRLEAQSLAARGVPRHLPIARVDRRRQQHALTVRSTVRPHRHQRRLGDRRTAVVERGVRDLEPGQARHHGLVLVDELQSALTGLGLIGRIRAVELAACGDRPNRGRDMVLIGTAPQERQRLAVPSRPLGHQSADLHLREAGRDTVEALHAQARGDLVEQRFDRRCADRRKHETDIFLGVRDERHGLSLLSQRVVRRRLRRRASPRARPSKRAAGAASNRARSNPG